MSGEPKKDPKPVNGRLTNACTSLQVAGQLVRFYRRNFMAKPGKYSDENQAGEYSSPVCYAHLREFREGF
ncbi:hypothetical protein [Pontibacter amylolyticus]|uniref:Uncharacterized protein n=1 Tax=Pontibacter amylolyticus TaxID=1424080 RepID=A0ABQ1VWY4_9BACT|nr:hypothetical protein [Pontibacter amylolyticus]GGG03581.1 hypothetical protein GCM10011323_05520 [Pontibacter amylolyticus]